MKNEFKSIDTNFFKVQEKIKLAEIPTLLQVKASEAKKERKLAEISCKLGELQDVMYAHNRYSVLIVFQGMDTSGKDSLIREVFKEFNPRGVVVNSFKEPTVNELKHDYLWRHIIALPQRGKFGIFNRSHYENVIVSRVHPEYVLNENLPEIQSVSDIPKDFWEKRFEQINNFEEGLVQNGMIILKFFMHLSKEEQRLRLLRRLEEEKHNWKFSEGDLQEREFWDDYRNYYETAIQETSKGHAPWFVIPADDKEMARFIVAKIIWEEMQRYTDIKEPELDEAIKDRFAEFKRKLKE